MEQLPSYFRLSSRAIGEMISDVRHRRDGSEILFVFDPHDLIEFCFPIDPGSKQQPDIGAISDDQAALFEVFMRRKQPAILIREYEREVARHSTYLEYELDDALDKAEIVDYFLRPLNLQGASTKPDEKLVTLLQKDFTVVLAAMMGLYSFGVERFRSIVGTRLCSESGFQLCPPDLIGQEVVSAFAAARPTFLYTQLREFLFAQIRDVELESDLMKRQLAADNDALAVDKLLQVNATLEKAFKEGKLRHRKIFLYLSSAEKTNKLFAQFEPLKTALPSIDGTPFNIWRTRSQIFASLIFKQHLGSADKENSREDYEALAANLQNFHELVKSIEELYPPATRQSNTQCQSCFLREGNQWNYKPSHKEECPWTDLCRHVSRSSFKTQATELQNLGLLANIQRYAQLSTVSGKNADTKELLEIVRRVFSSSGIADIALARLLSVQEKIATRSQFAQLMSEGLEVMQDDLGRGTENDESVTSPIQTLPLALQLSEQQYIEIVDNFIVRYTGARSFSKRTELLIENYKMFLGYEKQNVLSSHEHELVRCLLYLARETNAGRQLAMKHVSVISEKFRKHPDYLKECHYVLLWALRKNGCFKEAERLAQEVIKQDPADPRIWHGRLLNGYEWRMTSNANCALRMPDLFEFGEQALNLHNQSHHKLKISDNLYQLLRIVLLNDLAFLYVVDNVFHDVPRAKGFLEKLKELCPPEHWNETNPEFVHTEAMITFRELSRATSSDAISRLKIALRSLEAATDILPKREFLELATRIRRALHRADLRNKTV